MQTTFRLTPLTLLILVLTIACVPPTGNPPTASSGGVRTGGSLPTGSRVNIVIESATVHKLPFDILDGDTAQLQLMIFWSDGWLLDRYSSYFGDTARTARVGSVFNDLNAGYVGFSPDQVQDEVYVWFLAVDNDENDMMVDTAAGLLLDEFGQQVEHWVERRTIQAAARTNIVSAFITGMLDVIYSVVEQPDLIGQQAFRLRREDSWNAGTFALQTDDGALSVIYRIEVIENSILQEPTEQPPRQNPPTPIPTSPPAAQRTGNSASLNGTVDTGRLNLRYRPSTDSYIVYRVSQYDRVLVLGRNQTLDWVLIDAGIVGWVNADYIVIEGNISHLPLITSPSQYPAPSMSISFICPGANGPNFHIGDRFVVPHGDGPSGVFAEPGREPVLGRVPEGTGGRILGGPVCATAPDNRYLIWYYVETNNGLAGYMNESLAETHIKAIVPA